MFKWYVKVRSRAKQWSECISHQAGAVSIEYVGLATVVAAIIVALLDYKTGIAGALADVIMSAIGSVGGG